MKFSGRGPHLLRLTNYLAGRLRVEREGVLALELSWNYLCCRQQLRGNLELPDRDP
jgi:hypothetical protein